MPAAIFSGSDVKILKTQLDLNGQCKILSGTTDPTSVAVSAPIGSMYMNSSTGLLYRKTDSGSSTNWQLIRSGAANYLAATSSAKTPTASGNYSQMTNNVLALTAGQWMLLAEVHFTSSGGSPTYSEVSASFTAANGADSSSVPSALSVDAGRSVDFGRILGVSGTVSIFGAVRVTVGSTTNAYCVPFAAMSTPANSRITTYFWAERITI